LAISIRSDPNILELLRQIVAQGATIESRTGIGAIKGEQQPHLGGSDQSQPAGGHQEIGIDHTSVYETALNDHEYFQSDVAAAVNVNIINGSTTITSTNAAASVPLVNLLSPASSLSSSSSISSSNHGDFDFNSILQSNDDDVNLGAYFQQPQENPLLDSIMFNDPTTKNANDNNQQQQHLQVPASPNLNNLEADLDFPQLGDDILQQALQTLGDFNKFTSESSMASGFTQNTGPIQNDQSTPSTSNNMNSFNMNSIGFDDFLQNDDYNDNDLMWEESFAQLFPSLSGTQ
jgi:hypothetical protein